MQIPQITVRERINYHRTRNPCGHEGPPTIVMGALCEDCAGSPPQRSYCILNKNHSGVHVFATGLDKSVGAKKPF